MASAIIYFMVTIADALSLASQHHQNGQLKEAEEILRQVLAAQADNVDALRLMGTIASQANQPQIASAYFGQVVSLTPHDAISHYNLGVAFFGLRRLEEAGNAFRNAIAIDPRLYQAYCNLGAVLIDQGAVVEAIAVCRHAITLNPNHALSHNNLGKALQDLRKSAESEVACREAIRLDPQNAQAYNNLGNALRDLGQTKAAIEACRQALALQPLFPEASNNLGNALRDAGDYANAIDAYRQAIVLQPHVSMFHNNLASALKSQGNVQDAIAVFRQAININPQDADAYNNLGSALVDLWQVDEGIRCFEKALSLKPTAAHFRSNLLQSLPYAPGVTLAQLAHAHAVYEEQYAAPLRNALPPLPPLGYGNQRLRIGFVSQDFGRHPVGYFLIGLFENLRRDAEFDTYCYSTRAIKDDLTSSFEWAASHWVDVAGLDDAQLAQRIREDKIDILFDLAGHTSGNRLLVFARKPAPIQITWAGYVGTTGLKAMDYLLADRFHVPREAEHFTQEKVLRMPDDYICYQPPEDAPAVNLLPALTGQPFTFGCFSNPAKVTAPVIELWGKILRRKPESRLIFRFKSWDDRAVMSETIARFRSAGIDASRLKFFGGSPHKEFLQGYHEIDLALDTFPYSGGLTTCEALWMGVPVITCPGETFASRHAFGHLSNAGVSGTIADDWRQYVELAVEWANDLPRLSALRASLRDKMRTSPLCDAARFAKHFRDLMLRVAWPMQPNSAP